MLDTDMAAAENKRTKKYKVGAVSYLNTRPLVYGFEKGMMKDEVELSFDYPGKIAAQLLNGTIDIGLVPVAVLPLLTEYYFAADYCIAADGPVASVCLFSEVPLQEITTILLDYQSRTSVMLVQYLCKEYWKIQPAFKDGGTDFIQQINGTTAAVIIGDRAFTQRAVSPFTYDLAAAWKQHTGLPFVFAAWVSNQPLPEQFMAQFNAANAYGLNRIQEVVAANPYTQFDLHTYYTQLINYRFDADKKKGLSQFLRFCEAESQERNTLKQVLH